jgi:hypothetical protein
VVGCAWLWLVVAGLAQRKPTNTKLLGCAHRMAIHPCSKVAGYLGWAHCMAIHPGSRLQRVMDEPTGGHPLLLHIFARDVELYPSYGHPPSSLSLFQRCEVIGMCPRHGHPIFSNFYARDLGCAHRMAIHPCSKVARYLGWAHRMAIPP